MKTERAKEILQSLIQGADPFTGETLECDVLQKADVMRALLAGVWALTEESLRETRRAMMPKNVGTRWTDEEHQQLVTAFQAGDSPEVIAERHCRALRGIEARLEKFGFITRAERKTVDRG